MGILSWLFGRKRTRVVVRFDTGLDHHLFIRGQGAGLCWDKGLPLSNQGTDCWVWETNQPIPESCEFKILIDDKVFEEGPNHRLMDREICTIQPEFRA